MSEHPPRIVVVGSVNVDLIVRSERLPRPGETVVGEELVTAGGGKGANQAVAARRLGGDVAFVARVGRDGPGELSTVAYRAEGLDLTGLTVDPEAPTGVALILVDRAGQNLISVAPGANLRLTAAQVREAVPLFARADVLISQLEVPPETVRTALELGRENGLMTILNPAPARPMSDDVLGLVDWLTPNETEAAILSGMPVQDQESAIHAGKRLLERGARNVVVTLGERGAVLVASDTIAVLPPFAVAAVDTTSAGDAFTAGLAVGLARGLDVLAVLRFASAAGSLATTRVGAQPSLPRESEVADLLRTRSNPVSSAGGARG